MALVPAKCTQCGGILEVDDTHDAGICQFCGTPFITEKAINNYTVTNNINADVVNIYGGASSDFVIRAGTLEKYNGAATEVIIPDNVKSIGEKCFEGCKNLTNITIPNGVTSIGRQAFSGCEGLISITMPDSVVSLDSFAFADCESLKKITFSRNLKSIGSFAFCNCVSLTDVYIPKSVTEIHMAAFSGCTNLKDVAIPEHLAEGNADIRDSAFTKCSSSLNIHLPNGTPVRKKEPINNQKQSSACYIATCVYGSYDCPEVWTLRRFRDYTLYESWYGRLFIRFYYTISPKLVKWFGNYKWFKKPWKKCLDIMVKRLNNNGVANTKYNDKY